MYFEEIHAFGNVRIDKPISFRPYDLHQVSLCYRRPALEEARSLFKIEIQMKNLIVQCCIYRLLS